MIVPDHLHQLVHALTPTEKRYLSINFVKPHTNGTELAKLIKAIEKMEIYSEEGLKKKLAGSRLLKNFPVEKLRLIDLILKAMRHYHEQDNIEDEVYSQFRDVLFLFQRGNFDYCIKRYKVAKKNAKRYELFGLLLDMLDWERKLVVRLFEQDIVKRISEIEQERIEIQELAINYTEYLNLYTKYQLFNRTKYRNREINEVVKLKTSTLLRNISSAKSFQAKHLFYYAKIELAIFEGDYSVLDRNCKHLVSLWESHPEKIQSAPHKYNSVIGNYLTYFHNKLSESEFSDWQKKYVKPSRNDLYAEGQHFNRIIYLDIWYNLVNGYFDKLTNIAPKLEDGLAKYRSIIEKSRQQGMIYNMSIGFFLMEDYDRAMDWLDKLIHAKWEVRADMEIFGKMLELVCRYEMQFGTLDTLLRSLKRYLTNVTSKIGYEAIFIKHFNAIINLPRSGAELKKQCRAFLDELSDYEKNNPGNVTGIGELNFWVQSKVEARPIKEIYLEELKANKPK